MPKRTAAYAVSPRTQSLFVVFAAAAVLMQLAIIAYWMIKQYSSNHNFSGFLIPAVQGIVAPLVFFITAYLIRKIDGSQKVRIFDAALIATIGVLLAGILTQSTVFYQGLYIYYGGYWRSALYYLVPLGLAYLVYLVFLLRNKSK